MTNSIKIYIDGACQPNPGRWNRNLCKRRWLEESFSLPLDGTVTNNIAEYQALIFSLKLISKIFKIR